MMPKNLVLVRHGLSEGNVANKRSRAGDQSAFTDAFRSRHSSSWRLVDEGRAQAIAAGRWMQRHLAFRFGRFYCTEYARGKETAALLGLGGPWFTDFYLRERDWGELDVLPDDERTARFARELARRDADAFFWTPPNGESLAQLCLRVDRVLHTLHRECSDTNVIAVCHGEVMWAFRVRLERMPQRVFRRLDASDDPLDHIHNCQILHYTRIDPKTGEEAPYLQWMRSVCPWDPARSRNVWQEIVRPRYFDEDLLAEVHDIGQMVF